MTSQTSPSTPSSPTAYDLEGRTFLITGATSGIGRAAAVALARRGGRLLLACRATGTADEVAADVDALPGPSTAAVVPLDLADLDSVRRCAADVLARDEPIHVLVNNAGVAGKKGATTQGFELTFGVNHLGHFLLTGLLLDHLRASGVAGAPARVVTVASNAHFGAKGIDFDALRRPTRSFGGLREYQVSKLCNVLFVQELARRLREPGPDGAPPGSVTAYSVHPGVVASDIWRQVPWPIRPIAKRFMITPEAGAAGPVHCATAPDLEPLSGSYFDLTQLHDMSPHATPELAATLWGRSEEWVAE
jgi:NAD(P)-dependent dehydrogenase (short-subunit alcohol dehydrogenase family)